MKPISGQLIVRGAGFRPDGMPNTKRLVMVVGILAVPAGDVILDEHQYTVNGAVMVDGRVSLLQANIDLHEAVDVSASTRGCGLGHLVTLPIWRA